MSQTEETYGNPSCTNAEDGRMNVLVDALVASPRQYRALTGAVLEPGPSDPPASPADAAFVAAIREAFASVYTPEFEDLLARYAAVAADVGRRIPEFRPPPLDGLAVLRVIVSRLMASSDRTAALAGAKLGRAVQNADSRRRSAAAG